MTSYPRDELVRRQSELEAAVTAQSGMLKEIRDRLVAVEKDTAFTRGQLAGWQDRPAPHVVRPQRRWRQQATNAGIIAALVAIAEAAREFFHHVA